MSNTMTSFFPNKKTSVWGAKLMFGGYSGLKHTADKINDYIPVSKIYVEPFAGLGRTVELRHEKIILNDMSEYAVDYLRNEYAEYSETCEFPITVTQEDYMKRKKYSNYKKR